MASVSYQNSTIAFQISLGREETHKLHLIASLDDNVVDIENHQNPHLSTFDRNNKEFNRAIKGEQEIFWVTLNY